MAFKGFPGKGSRRMFPVPTREEEGGSGYFLGTATPPPRSGWDLSVPLVRLVEARGANETAHSRNEPQMRRDGW